MFCTKCGGEIAENAEICIYCRQYAKAGDRFCSSCGQETAAYAAYCARCGAPVYTGMMKSKLAAGLLGIFLGAFGVHNFYLGYNGKAIAQLLMTLCSCGALSFISAIWGFVEGIIILTAPYYRDAAGRPLQQ